MDLRPDSKKGQRVSAAELNALKRRASQKITVSGAHVFQDSTGTHMAIRARGDDEVGLTWVAKVSLDSETGIYVGLPVEHQLESEPGGGWVEEPDPGTSPDPDSARVLWRIKPDAEDETHFEFAGQTTINGQYPDVLPPLPETMYEAGENYHPQYQPNLGKAPNGWCPVLLAKVGPKAFVVYSPFGGVLGGPSDFPELPLE